MTYEITHLDPAPGSGGIITWSLPRTWRLHEARQLWRAMRQLYPDAQLYETDIRELVAP